MDHLRGGIARGMVTHPLPNTREWSAKLGVGRGTLEDALRVLEREGLVRIRPRKGVQILPSKRQPGSSRRRRVVRWCLYARDYPHVSMWMEVFHAISERLRPHNVDFVIERCDSIRLQAIHQRGETPDELLLLASLTERFQRLFQDFKKSSLILGIPFQGISLPYVSTDWISAVRHATYMLARRNFQKVSLVLKSRIPMTETFSQICAQSPRLIKGDVFPMPNDFDEQIHAARRLAGRMAGRHAFIVIYPIPPSLMMTALLQRGLEVPGTAEVVGVNTILPSIQVVPVPIHYPYPVSELAKTLCKAAMHYFEKGSVPVLRKLIPLKMVPARAGGPAGWTRLWPEKNATNEILPSHSPKTTMR